MFPSEKQEPRKPRNLENQEKRKWTTGVVTVWKEEDVNTS